MAEGGKWSRSFKDSFSKASGDVDESFCDPCKSEDKHIAVEGFCPVCNEYLCETCLRVHRKQRITRAHVILDKKQMPSGGQGSASNQDMCVEVCKPHHPEIIRFFCKSHDKAGCGDCMTLNHKTCSRERVQDISGGFQTTKEFQDIDKKLQWIHKELEKMDGELDDKWNNLDTTYNKILKKIATGRKQINDYLDQTEKEIKDKAARMKKAEEAELKTFQAEHQAMKTEIKIMLKALHDSNTNMTSLFVISKQAKHRLVTMEKDINTIQKSQHTKYDFNISNEIENLISTNAPFGKLSRQSSQTSRGMTEKQDQKTPRAPTVDSTATHNRSINVKGKTETEDCYIIDCAILSPDRLVVVDINNKNVKLIDLSNNTVISSYSISSEPRRVTALNANTIAVTLHDVCKIQVLNVTSTFTLQREIKVNKNCGGIAYKDEKFAVSYSNPGRVDVLDTQGKRLHTIQPQQDNNTILHQPFHITFGQNKDTVIVSDNSTHKVSVVTFRGQILRTYTHDTLRSPRGIVMTADGVLYVCSWMGGCIHVVSPDFKTSRIIIYNDRHVEDPRGITYCEINHRLYISNDVPLYREGDLSNYIQVYDVKVPV